MFEIIGHGRDEFMSELASDIQRHGRAPNLLITDIRDFAKINATVGYQSSDAFLRRIFNIVRDTLPPYIKMYSYAGDKFVAKFDLQAPHGSIEATMEHIKKLCSTPIMVSGITFTVDVWIGCRPASQVGNVADAVYALEESLKNVKRSVYDSFNTCVEDSPSNVTPMSAAVNAKFNLGRIHQITTGIKQGAVIPYAQAIVNYKEEVVGYEILARMKLRNELEYPERFMPVIRSRNLMALFTKEIIKQVVNVVQLNGAGAVPGAFLAFNIDFETMCTSECVEYIKQAVTAVKGCGYRVKLEISEESLTEDVAVASKMFDIYRAVGVEISIDDFGTMYSNFHRVSQLSFGEIKVDKSFGLTCSTDPASALFVEFTKKLADLKGAQCVVEGVETVTQFEALKRIGITRFQGYLFARPEPLMKILDTHREDGSKKVIVF